MIERFLHFSIRNTALLGGGVGGYAGASYLTGLGARWDPESPLGRRVADDPMGTRMGLLTAAGLGAGYMAYHVLAAGSQTVGAANAMASLGRGAFTVGQSAGRSMYRFGKDLYGAIFRDRAGQLVTPRQLLSSPEEYLPRVKALVLGATAFKMGMDVMTHHNRMARAYAQQMDWRQARAPLDFALGVDGDIVLASYYNARSVWETAVT